ncbi:MAG: serine/threonine protein kinase [Myxococcota bacterium]
MFQPTTFGKYFLTRRIAVGGMAEVFAAKLYGADGFEKDLVIKQILPQYSKDPEFIQSFVGEAKIAVSLNHANVVGIYELGRVDGTYFIAMEYVDGLDVFQLLDYARKFGLSVSPGIALLVTEEVAKGLDYAHRKLGPDAEPLGLVHRDLNPRNVLISREGEVKILDFGIAKTASKAAAMPKTRAGVVKGTTGYMSPEQAVGLEVDTRTDIYQSGLLLYELLTGEALFWRPDDEVTRSLMRAHRVHPPSETVPDLPLDVDQLCLRLLSRDPSQRPQTASDLVQILGRLRFLFYPDQDHRALGRLVQGLLTQRQKEEALTESAPVSLPSTLELSEVISRAIEHTITEDVETIATRFPRRGQPAPGAVPLQVKSDSSVEETPALGTAQPHGLPASLVRDELGPPEIDSVLDEDRTGSSTADLMPSPASSIPYSVLAASQAILRDRRWAYLGAAALVALFVIAAAAWPDKEPARPLVAATSTAEAHPDPEQVVIQGAEEREAEEAVREAFGPEPAADDKDSRREADEPEPKPETVLFSATTHDTVVAFGTRSCSSRVSVDGQVVTRSTPSYDHLLTPGRHRIVVEGISCPAVERPGSLRRATPIVVRDVDIPAGANLKIIADFDADKLIVKTY